jgi:hypothetical protein
MASPLKGKWTLKLLMKHSYALKEGRERYDNMRDDRVHSVRIEKTDVYGERQEGEARTKYTIFSLSENSSYLVTLQLDRLSLNVPFKARTGAGGLWKNSKNQKAQENPKSLPYTAYRISPDFQFRLEYVFAEEGILFGRRWSKLPPVKTNPKKLVYMDKHFLSTVKYLMKMGILKDD